MARPDEVAHDESPSVVEDHPYESKGEWWDLCRHCNLAESAHRESTVLHYVGDDMVEEE
jgi:hypothetical protein